jgi:hypothetical protein
MIFTVFLLLSDMGTGVNVPSLRNYQKNLIFCWHLESHCRKEQDPDPDGSKNPDPFQNVTETEHSIRPLTIILNGTQHSK